MQKNINSEKRKGEKAMLIKMLAIISLVMFAACQSQAPLVPITEMIAEKKKTNYRTPNKYEGKEVMVRGYVYSEANMEGSGEYINLEEKGGNSSQYIGCLFHAKDATEFSKIKGSQYITVKGIYKDGNDLESCILVNAEPPAIYPVKFVDRNEAFHSDQKPDAYDVDVVVTIEDRKLSLGYQNIGDINDITPLTEKLKEEFEVREKVSQTREKGSFDVRKVIIEQKGKVENRDLEMLIGRLAEAKASPILVIKNDSQ